MAMPSYKITKTQFKEQYNVVEILTDKSEIMKQLQTFNSKNQAVAFGYRKRPGITLEDVIIEMRNGFKTIDQEIQEIKTRLDNIVKLNNLKEA